MIGVLIAPIIFQLYAMEDQLNQASLPLKTVVAAPSTSLFVEVTLSEKIPEVLDQRMQLIKETLQQIPELGEGYFSEQYQLLFNEQVLVQKRVGDWLFVVVPHLTYWKQNKDVTRDITVVACQGWVKVQDIVSAQCYEPSNLVVKVSGAKITGNYVSGITLGLPQPIPLMCKELPVGARLVGESYGGNDAFWTIKMPNGDDAFIESRDVMRYQEFKPENLEQTRRTIIELAFSLCGTPFAWGGRSSLQGFDASGLMQVVYGACGVSLHRNLYSQYIDTQPIEPSNMQKADLIFLGQKREEDPIKIYSVMMYLGDGLLLFDDLQGIKTASVQERLGKQLHELKNGDTILGNSVVAFGSPFPSTEEN